jgi:hypothetical protein
MEEGLKSKIKALQNVMTDIIKKIKFKKKAHIIVK